MADLTKKLLAIHAPCSYRNRITLLQAGQWPIPWTSALRFTFQNEQLSTPHRNKSSSY